jgi:hypothetical protein
MITSSRPRTNRSGRRVREMEKIKKYQAIRERWMETQEDNVAVYHGSCNVKVKASARDMSQQKNHSLQMIEHPLIWICASCYHDTRKHLVFLCISG